MEIICMLGLCGFSTQCLVTENYFVIYVLKNELYLPFKLYQPVHLQQMCFFFVVLANHVNRWAS